jgi:hypothetical protein
MAVLAKIVGSLPGGRHEAQRGMAQNPYMSMQFLERKDDYSAYDCLDSIAYPAF